MIYLNGSPVNTTIFSDSTSQVWKLDQEFLNKGTFAKIEWVYSHEGEVMQLAQLKHLLEYYGVPKVHLHIKYLPYARQDKEISNTSTFALRTFAIMLNNMNFSKVVVLDPHSKQASRLINNFVEETATSQAYAVAEMVQADVICFPDAGALEKYRNRFYHKQIYGEKVRDQLTGAITHYQLVGDCADKNVLIVDDICDAGMTFKLLAKELLVAGAKGVVLFVTHGIFSKGTRTLFDSGISRVFTHDGEVGPREGSINV